MDERPSTRRQWLALAAIVIVAGATMAWYAWRDTPLLAGPTAANETQVSVSPAVTEAPAPVQKPVPAITAAPPSVETIAPQQAEKEIVVPMTPAASPVVEGQRIFRRTYSIDGLCREHETPL